ncbi:MAG: CDP-alcohol phosphatidyltransferase family protein [Thaumarchaeota archaeon]|nr:CDP-alcohol phosphatidyltransferase family protein [Candidatus Calditenuaceae archaeon]MDW8042895.1 CDP-alcohol phosphatidyltransferase family protein [Nitrososphaerota archaeon]
MRGKRELEREVLRRASGWLVEAMVRRRVSPFALTYSALGLAALAASMFALHRAWAWFVPLGGLVYLASGLLDALDGEVARREGRVTARGAFEDSVLDKFGEAAVSVGLLMGPAGGLEVLLFATGSLLVSYARARAESLGVELAGIGVAERAERTVGLVVGTLTYPLWEHVLNLALAAVGVAAYATAVQRFVVASRALAGRGDPSPGGRR